jgi:release factor glutamine methyltransferase
MPEVALYEPGSALDGGADGLSAYRIIIPELPRLLARAGAAVLEVGDGQAASVTALGRAAGLDGVTTHADLTGVARAVVLRPPAR